MTRRATRMRQVLMCLSCLAVLSDCSASRSRTASHDALWQQSYDAGKAAYDQGRYGDAERQFRASLEEAEGFGPDDLRRAKSLHNLAAVYAAEGKYAKAEPLYKQSLAILERALGPQDPAVATCLENEAAVLRQIGRVAEAQKLEGQALAIRNGLATGGK